MDKIMYFECDCGDKDHMLIFETFNYQRSVKKWELFI